MAITATKITTYANSIASLSDKPADDGLTPTQLKALFDSRTDSEVKTAVNAIIDDITVINNAVASLVATSVPDDSVTNAMLAADVKVGSLAALTTTEKTNVVGALNEVKATIGTNANYKVSLTSNVTMTNANTWYDAVSLELPAGTYLVIGRATIQTGTAGRTMHIRVTDKTSTYASAVEYAPSDSKPCSAGVYYIAVLTGTTTVYLQGMGENATASTILAESYSGLGNVATQLTAVKIG